MGSRRPGSQVGGERGKMEGEKKRKSYLVQTEGHQRGDGKPRARQQQAEEAEVCPLSAGEEGLASLI